jgi:hypothetical protein
MKIITDNKPRKLLSLNELPAKEQMEFDYVREKGYCPTERFVFYKGCYYDTHDTQVIRVSQSNDPMGWAMVVKPDSPLAKWHSIVSETYFSGVLFRFVNDEVIVGRYYE